MHGVTRGSRFLRLDQHRQAREARVMKEAMERREAEVAFADVLMTIDTAPAWPLGIVGVKHAEAIDADEPLECGEGLLIPALADDIVAGRDEVAGIEADTDPRGSVQVLEDRREMLEAISDRTALPCARGSPSSCAAAASGMRRESRMQ